jgi:hypothetical protein
VEKALAGAAEIILEEELRGEIAARHDQRLGRSYAEQGEDVANEPWHRGYLRGWKI